MLHKFTVLLMAGFLGALSGHALAVEQTPKTIPGGKYVTTAEAKALFDKGATFVDARVKAEYVEKHIKGAINAVYKETKSTTKTSKTDPADTFNEAKLPKSKTTEMVFYCNGSPCWKGYKGADRAIKAGYKKVYWYRDGMLGWGEAKYPMD